MTGEIMSPVISIRSAIEPIQFLSSESIAGGITSAMSLPRRVTRRGVLVLLTSSSNDKHSALNLEIAISRIRFFPRLSIVGLPLTTQVYHGHLKWSGILQLCQSRNGLSHSIVEVLDRIAEREICYGLARLGIGRVAKSISS